MSPPRSYRSPTTRALALGHSFGYIRLDALATAASTASSKVHHSEKTTTFRTISDASVSANTATSLSTPLPTSPAAATAFESSTSFSFVPLQPVPRFSSRPLSGPFAPVDREFFSGPIERGFTSSPLNHHAPSGCLPWSRSHGLAFRRCLHRTAASLLHDLTRGIARTMLPPLPVTSSTTPFPDRCPPTTPCTTPSSDRPRLPPHGLLRCPFPCPLPPPPPSLPPCDLSLVATPSPHPARDLLSLPPPRHSPPPCDHLLVAALPAHDLFCHPFPYLPPSLRPPPSPLSLPAPFLMTFL